MPRLKDGRNSLLIAHNNSLPSDEDLLLLLDENSSENPQFNYEKYERFHIYGGPQGSLHKKGHAHIKHCNLCKQKRLLQIKRELLQIKKDVGANKKSCCK